MISYFINSKNIDIVDFLNAFNKNYKKTTHGGRSATAGVSRPGMPSKKGKSSSLSKLSKKDRLLMESDVGKSAFGSGSTSKVE